MARGAKLFAGKGLDPALWTDDGSTYVELWGGANRTFFPEDDRTLAAGRRRGVDRDLERDDGGF